MNIIIDTNLWISFAIGKKMSVMRVLLTHPDIRIYVCDELLDEFAHVSMRLKIRKYIRGLLKIKTASFLVFFQGMWHTYGSFSMS